MAAFAQAFIEVQDFQELGTISIGIGLNIKSSNLTQVSTCKMTCNHFQHFAVG